MVVNSHRHHFLRVILSNDVFVQEFKDLHEQMFEVREFNERNTRPSSVLEVVDVS